MKVTHMTVFIVAIAGLAYLAMRNHGGMSGMFTPNSDGSALGGPVYSSTKARISIGKLGAQPSGFSYGASNQNLLQSITSRIGRGA